MFQYGIGFQYYKPEKTFHMKRKGIYEFIVDDDETLMKGGNELVWLMWIATELKAKKFFEYVYHTKRVYTIAAHFTYDH